MCGYTRNRSKVTADHIESDTYHNQRGVIRVHTFRCRTCGKEWLQGREPYTYCPHCGMPVVHYDGRAGA